MEEVGVVLMLMNLFLLPQMGHADLRTHYYADVCPNVERIVREAVQAKFQETSITIPATLRLFFHDCFVQGCDASILIASTEDSTAEKDHPDNLSLAGDGFDTVLRAKAAVDAIPECRHQVSCADILTMATRDVVDLSGGPSYAVELGRLDGLSSTEESVEGKLPRPDFDLEQLASMFATNDLSITDLVALSGAHTVGFSHCNNFANRIYNFSQEIPIDPTLNKAYAAQLQASCPKNVDPRAAVSMDPITPLVFDNAYYKNLRRGMGLFTSDQVLYRHAKTWRQVNAWSQDSIAFHGAFVAAMTNLGRVGVKTGSQGNIRRNCLVFN